MGVGGGVGARIDRGRRPLEHEQVLGIATEVRYQLDARGTGSDECDALVRQLGQAAVGVSAGVVVVPTGGVEHVPTGGLVLLDARDSGKFRAVVRALSHHDEASADVVSAVGADPPALGGVVPDQFADLGGEQRAVV